MTPIELIELIAKLQTLAPPEELQALILKPSGEVVAISLSSEHAKTAIKLLKRMTA